MKTDPKAGKKAAVNFALPDGVPALPHERDQAPDKAPAKPNKAMVQASKDLQRGLVDTDMHGDRGVEAVVNKTHTDTDTAAAGAATGGVHAPRRILKKPPAPN